MPYSGPRRRLGGWRRESTWAQPRRRVHHAFFRSISSGAHEELSACAQRFGLIPELPARARARPRVAHRLVQVRLCHARRSSRRRRAGNGRERPAQRVHLGCGRTCSRSGSRGRSRSGSVHAVGVAAGAGARAAATAAAAAAAAAALE
eukprot:1818753-Prymnesium_polylepis.1